MDETIVTHQHMEALKALADTNLKVSDARNTLTELEEHETEYLISREKRAVARIQAVLEQSHSLVEETNKNYELISDFARSVTEGVACLNETNAAFKSLVETKEQFFQNWERDIKNQEETIAALAKGLKIERAEVESRKSQLEADRNSIEEERKKIRDERGTLDRAIERLKENRI